MSMEQKNQTEMNYGKKESNGPLYKILIVVFAIGLAVSLFFVIRNAVTKKNANDQYDALAAKSTEAQTESAEPETGEPDILAELGITVPEKNLDWDALKEVNEDIYAWIYIPGTQVDYPILQHPENENYYLDHNLDGSTGYPGCLYTHSLNSKMFTDPNTVIYGHNMKDGTMFGDLHGYADNTFFADNKYIYIYTPDDTFVYEIFTASEFGDEHLLFAYNFYQPGELARFADDISSVRDMNAHVREEIEVAADDRIVTLSTCIGSKKNNRWLVTGVLVNNSAKTPATIR